MKCHLLRVAVGEFNSSVGGHFREESLHVLEFVVRKLEGSVAPFWSRSLDQSEVPEHSGDRMFSINLPSVPEIENVAVVLQFAQDQVRAVQGYAIIGIQGIVEDDVDEMSLFELVLPLPSRHLRKRRS